MQCGQGDEFCISRTNVGLGSCYEDDMQASFPDMNLPYTTASELVSADAYNIGETEAAERKLDQVLSDSFPASDPPPWTFGREENDRVDR